MPDVRRALLASVVAAVCLLAPAAPAHARGAGSCASASAQPGHASMAAVRGATLCLLNGERRRRGLRPLRLQGQLSTAASRHAREMVRRRYFAHDSLDGRSFVTRIRRAGYLRGAGRWLVGENLAWGSGDRATPRAIVNAWMDSPGHRRNILNGEFREIGIALVRRAPVPDAGRAATYVTEFGAR